MIAQGKWKPPSPDISKAKFSTTMIAYRQTPATKESDADQCPLDMPLADNWHHPL